MENIKIGFIGAGNIATAIINGIIGSGYIKTDSIFIYDTLTEKTELFKNKGIVVSTSPETLATICNYVFLTVKPQVYETVLEGIKSSAHNTCFIDVAAGITTDFVKSILGFDAPVIRVMPNTPLLYGEGASAIARSSSVTDEQFAFIKGCFDSCGITAVVDEKYINTVTAISGSAPAYFMRTAKDFIDFATESGMTIEDAKALVLQTMIGSAKMISNSEVTIDGLIKAVTSPNGTTEAGLRSLDNDEFDNIIKNCLSATEKRAVELTR